MDRFQKTKTTKEKKEGLIYKEHGITIKTDPYQYILYMEGYTMSFHATLANVFEEVYSRKEKENLVNSVDKSMVGILECIKKTQGWLKRLLKPLDGVSP